MHHPSTSIKQLHALGQLLSRDGKDGALLPSFTKAAKHANEPRQRVMSGTQLIRRESWCTVCIMSSAGGPVPVMVDGR